jgi:anti-sigma factor RsiW
MKLDDESLLTAYLDGELDPNRKVVVESTLLSKPQLAERLQELAAVRSLVDGMARPTVSYDLSGPIVAEIQGWPLFRLGRAARYHATRPRNLIFASGVAAAAGLLLVFMLYRGHDHRNPVRPNVSVAKVPSVLPLPHRSPDSSVRPTPHIGEPESAATDTIVAAEPEPQPIQLSETDRQQARDHERIRRLLDRPGVRRMTLLLDTMGTDQLTKVEAAIDQTHRADPVRATIRIAQDVVVDPSRPREAVVYLAVMDEAEHARFVENLEHQLPGVPVPPSIDDLAPAVVTQLADAGRVEVSEGEATPGLTTPPDDLHTQLAIQQDPGQAVAHVGLPRVEGPGRIAPVMPRTNVADAKRAVSPKVADGPRNRPYRSDLDPGQQLAKGADAAVRERAEQPDGESAIDVARGSHGRTVYLVWVTLPSEGDATPVGHP